MTRDSITCFTRVIESFTQLHGLPTGNPGNPDTGPILKCGKLIIINIDVARTTEWTTCRHWYN